MEGNNALVRKQCIRGKLSTYGISICLFQTGNKKMEVMYILSEILTYMYLISFIDIPNKWIIDLYIFYLKIYISQ